MKKWSKFVKNFMKNEYVTKDFGPSPRGLWLGESILACRRDKKLTSPLAQAHMLVSC